MPRGIFQGGWRRGGSRLAAGSGKEGECGADCMCSCKDLTANDISETENLGVKQSGKHEEIMVSVWGMLNVNCLQDFQSSRSSK